MWCLFTLRYDDNDLGVDDLVAFVVVASKYTDKKKCVEIIFTQKLIVKFKFNYKETTSHRLQSSLFYLQLRKAIFYRVPKLYCLLFAVQLQACFQHWKAQVSRLIYIRPR